MISNEEYDERKMFLEDLKILSKTEHEKLFQFLRTHNIEYSENSNGVFFDLTKIPSQLFEEFKAYIVFCKKIRSEQSERDEEEKKAQDFLR